MLLVGAVVSGAAPAAAAPTWLPLPAFPNATNGFTPRVAVSPGNDTVATWTTKDGPSSIAVAIATLPRGPGTPQTTTFSRGTAALGTPALALAPTGDAIVAWTEGRSMAFSLRQAPGGFQAPVPMAAPLGTTAQGGFFTSAVAVATDGTGKFLIAVGDRVPPPISGGITYLERVLIWTVDAASGLVTGPVAVSNSGAGQSASDYQISEISLAEAPDGSAVLAYKQTVAGEPRVLVTSRKGSGAFPDASVLDFTADQPRTAIDPSGRMLVAYRQLPVPAAPYEVRAYEAQPAGAFKFVGPFNTGTLSSATDPSGEPNVAIDVSGRATVVWQTCFSCGVAGAQRQVIAQRVKPDGTLDGSTQTISGASPDPNLMNPQIAMTPAGGAIALWKRQVAGHSVLEYARRAGPADPFAASAAVPGAPEIVSPGPDPGPYIGVDSDGNASAIWDRSGGVGTNEPFLARLDVTPPVPGPITVRGGPPDLFVPLDFSISPTDATSATSVRWDFGDGSPQPLGTSVRHSYTTRGKRIVTATVTDEAGNSATATTTIDLGMDQPPAPTLRFLGKATVSPQRFKPRKPKRRGGGTTFRWRLSGPARVEIKLTRSLPGRRSKGRCVAPTRALRHAKRCTRRSGAGTLSANARAGAGTLTFSGIVGGKPLSPGDYTATLVARSGTLRSAAATVAFTVTP
jgi:PKD repeat protein